MKDEEREDAVPGGVLHKLTHKVPGVPAHDGERGLGHQGSARRGGHPSLNGKLNGKPNGKINHKVDESADGAWRHQGSGRLNNRDPERHVLPGVQDKIAKLFGKAG